MIKEIPIIHEDMLVLLLNSHHLTLKDEFILSRYLSNGKPSVVGITVHDSDSADFQSRAVEDIKKQMKLFFERTENLPEVLPVRTDGSRLVNIDSIEQSLGLLASNSFLVQEGSFKCNIKILLHEQLMELNRIDDYSNGLEMKARLLNNQICALQELTRKDFFEIEMEVVQDCIVRLSKSIQDYCDSLFLLWKADNIAVDLLHIMKENSLAEAEYQVSFYNKDGIFDGENA